MKLEIPREKYVNSSAKDGRGMTFDFLQEINGKLDKLPCAEIKARVASLENKKSVIYNLFELATKKPKVTIYLILALCFGIGAAMGRIVVSDSYIDKIFGIIKLH